MMPRSPAELARLATGPHALHAYPPEHVLLVTNGGETITVGGYAPEGAVFVRCADGQDRWLAASDFGQVLHFKTDARARRAAMPTPTPAPPQEDTAARKRVAAEQKAREQARAAHELKTRRWEARCKLEAAGCYSTPTAVTRYLAAGEMRPIARYHDSIHALYASAR